MLAVSRKVYIFCMTVAPPLPSLCLNLFFRQLLRVKNNRTNCKPLKQYNKADEGPYSKLSTYVPIKLLIKMSLDIS